MPEHRARGLLDALAPGEERHLGRVVGIADLRLRRLVAFIWPPSRRDRLSRRFPALSKRAARAPVTVIVSSAVVPTGTSICCPLLFNGLKVPKLVFAAIESMSERIAWNWVSSWARG